jgi:DNA ligase (NAD+)
MDNNLVSDPADLFELKEGDLLPLERFAQKSAENLIEAIGAKKEITLARFVYALGIRNVGEETALDLAKHFSSLGRIKEAKFPELEKIQDVGPIVAQSIYQWFREKRNIEFLEKLKKANIRISLPVKVSSAKQKLRDKTFVLTGGLERMTRDEAKEKIRELGGDISESVSKETDFVIVGSEPGSKFQKAKKLGIKILNEKQFLALIS